MTEKFVTLPRELVEQALNAFERAGLWKQQQTMQALSDALEQWGREPVAEHTGCIRDVQPRRKPLSYEKIRKAWNDAEGCRYGYEDFARAVESAHNIK